MPMPERRRPAWCRAGALRDGGGSPALFLPGLYEDGLHLERDVHGSLAYGVVGIYVECLAPIADDDHLYQVAVMKCQAFVVAGCELLPYLAGDLLYVHLVIIHNCC